MMVAPCIQMFADWAPVRRNRARDALMLECNVAMRLSLTKAWGWIPVENLARLRNRTMHLSFTHEGYLCLT